MDNTEGFWSIEPDNLKLSEAIAYYYFQETPDDGKTRSVIYYPHYHDAINFYFNADVNWDENGRTISTTSKNCITCLYTSNPQKSRKVSLIGKTFKIGIVFNPLGLEHFMDHPLASINQGPITPFSYFGPSFNQLAQRLHGLTDITERRDILDAYFLERFSGFPDQLFKNIINRIVSSDHNFHVEEIAKELGVSRKTILRKFKKHIGHTPRDFKSVVRFRKALSTFQQNQNRSNLTSIAYESAYYDQADYIHHYKSLVGLTPKQLYNRIHQFGNNETYWTKI